MKMHPRDEALKQHARVSSCRHSKCSIVWLNVFVASAAYSVVFSLLTFLFNPDMRTSDKNYHFGVLVFSDEWRSTEQFRRRLHVSQNSPCSLALPMSIVAPIRHEERVFRWARCSRMVRSGRQRSRYSTRYNADPYASVFADTASHSDWDVGVAERKSEGWTAPGKQYLASSVDRTPRTPRLRHECCQSQSTDRATNPVSPDLA